MLRPSDAIPSDREIYRLGIVDFRILAGADDTEGAFAMGEFSGREGAWTVPHVHERSLEAFVVLDGRFTFTIGDEERLTEAGAFVLIPRNVRHLMRAEASGGRLLTLWTPSGLEQMFVELSRLSPEALRDPVTRREISKRFDSRPV